MRLTASFPAKRLNSVNPLDPSDNADMPARIARAAKTFAEYGRSIIVRQSPLAPPDLVRYLDGEGWSRFGESLVMTADLSALELSATVERIPLRDRARYVEASLVGASTLAGTAHRPHRHPGIDPAAGRNVRARGR